MVRENCYVVTLQTGDLGIIQLNVEDGSLDEPFLLAKTLFELSRDGSDMLEHWDSRIHTLAAIEVGLPRHWPLKATLTFKRRFPASRSQRNDWVFENGVFRVDPQAAQQRRDAAPAPRGP